MKRKTKKIVGIVLGLLLIFAMATGIFALVNNYKSEDDGFEKINLTYERGGLGSDGFYLDSNEYIYTKKAFSVNPGDVVRVTMDFESNVYYQLFYYSSEDDLIRCSDVSRRTNDYTVPEDVELVRIMILPFHNSTLSTDEKVVKWYEVSKYANQLTVGLSRTETVEEPTE